MTAGGMIIFGIDGSFAMYEHLQGSADVVALVNSGLGDAAIYQLLELLPLGKTLLPFLILVLVVGFVAPSMDSASLALAETVTKKGTPKMALRLFFCILLAVIPMSIILVGAEFTAIKQIAIIISAPFLIILAFVTVGLFKWLKHDWVTGALDENLALQAEEQKAEMLAKDAEAGAPAAETCCQAEAAE